MHVDRLELPFGQHNIVIETGRLAKQANGAVTVSYGGTVVLVTSCMSNEAPDDADFFPLLIDYQEKTYAAGRIPGGFLKREGRPSESEILISRIVDRPLRPFFPKNFFNSVQIVALVLSNDQEISADVLALIGASASLMISDIPFDGPIGAVRVALVNDELVINPSYDQRRQSDLDLLVAGSKQGVVMIEGEARESSEETVLKAIHFGFEKLKGILTAQEELAKSIGKAKAQYLCPQDRPILFNKTKKIYFEKLFKAYHLSDQEERQQAIDLIKKEAVNNLLVLDDCQQSSQECICIRDMNVVLDEMEADIVRSMIVEEKRRIDARGLSEIRSISCDIGVMPRTHGSALFTRGGTQSLAITTLGASSDDQPMDDVIGKANKSFILHYNFPPFCVGDVRPMRGPGRREIGHGALAEKALRSVLPNTEEFPYTIRVVSEILESNGSSSMATVCAGTLSLMDAGVPIKDPVAGISIGLISSGDQDVLLTDIMGIEDHFGDMDFKVAGTRKGITAIQLDLKIKGIHLDLIKKTLEQAKQARFEILDKMHVVLPAHRERVSEFAPKVVELKIDSSRIGEIIGPGGRTIKKIIAQTQASIDVHDDGRVLVSSIDRGACDQAVLLIHQILDEPEIGKVYDAIVKKVMSFGAFCEFLPGKEGLIHVSEFSDSFVKDMDSVVKVGDRFKVKLIHIDEQNRINLSRKQAE